MGKIMYGRVEARKVGTQEEVGRGMGNGKKKWTWIEGETDGRLKRGEHSSGRE